MKNLIKRYLGIVAIFLLFIAIPRAYALIPLSVNQGGTGVNTITGIIQGSGTSPFSAVTIGTGLSYSGGTLSAPGAGMSIGGTVTSGTAGSVLFIDPTATLAQDNANFFFDATNHFLGIGNVAPTSKIDISTNGLGATQTDASGLTLKNIQAAFSGNPQISPALRWTGKGFKTVGGSASFQSDWQSYVIPGQSGSTKSTWVLRSQLAGGGYTNMFSILDAGTGSAQATLTGTASTLTAGNLQATNSFIFGASAFVSLNGNVGSPGQFLTSGGGGAMTWTTATGTIGGGIGATQVAYGSGTNTITGDNNFTYDPAGDFSLATPNDANIFASHDFNASGDNNVLISSTQEGNHLEINADGSTALTSDSAGTLALRALNGTLEASATDGMFISNQASPIAIFLNNTSSNQHEIVNFSRQDDATDSMSIVLSDEPLTAGYSAPISSIGNGGGILMQKFGSSDPEWGRIPWINMSDFSIATLQVAGSNQIFFSTDDPHGWGVTNAAQTLGFYGDVGNNFSTTEYGIYGQSDGVTLMSRDEATGKIRYADRTWYADSILNNVGIGGCAGITTGANDLCIGNQAGNNLTDANRSVVIGTNIDAPSANSDGQLDIQNFIFGTGLTGTGSTISSGMIGIGLINPNTRFKIMAGSTTVAPFGLTSGTNLTTPVAGAMEYDGANLYFTPTGTIRKQIATTITSRSTAQTAAVANVLTQAVGSADGSFEVSANVLVTTATIHSFTTTVTYTDEGNTSRTVTLNFSTIAGAITPTIANAGGAVPYEGVPLHIRAKASTNIVIATTGTFTTVTYNVEGAITKIQ